MATTPTAKKGKPPRTLLIVGVVGLLLLGYLFLRSKSGSSAAAPTASGASSPVPQTSSDAGGDGQSSTDQGSADLLAALAGENQSLMKSFLDSTSGLISLAGSSFGAQSGSGSMAVAEPSGVSSGFASTTSTPFVNDAAFVTPTAPSQANAVDPAQAANAAALGVAAEPNMTLDQVNQQLATAGLPAQSYPSQISATPDAVGAIGGNIAPPLYGGWFTAPAGATNVNVLPSGAVTYVGSSGATFEQAPGKTRYVIKAA